MKPLPHFFRIWAHRSAGSMFGAASSPVMRNGAFLCFEDKARAQGECDRLNAHRGDVNVHYTVMPTHIEAALPSELTKRKPEEAPSFPALATAPCQASDCRSRPRRIA
jgi:hypothetical protein